MNEKSPSSDSLIESIDVLLEALNEKRDSLVTLISILQPQQKILDNFGAQFIAFLKMRLASNRFAFDLPEDEMRLLKKNLGFDALLEYKKVMSDLTATLQYIDHPLTIAEMNNSLAIIDNLIVELTRLRQQMKKGNKATIDEVKALMTKIVPVYIGVTIIAVNLYFQSFVSILGGILPILKLAEK